jgi:predicted transcriptional regulator
MAQIPACAVGVVVSTQRWKENSRKVADVMTREVITAAPQTSLRDIASILEKNGIKRVPIVDGGKIIGIVSRANLLQALAACATRSKAAHQTTQESAKALWSGSRPSHGAGHR